MSEALAIPAPAPVPPAITRSTPIETALDIWLKLGVSNRTEESDYSIRSRLKSFWVFFRGRPVESFTRDDIARWMNFERYELVTSQGQGNSGRTTRNKLKLIRAFFTYCFEDELISRNPVQWKRLPKLPMEAPRRNPFDFDQFQRIMAEARIAGKWADFWPSAIIIAWHTGLRSRDIMTLRWDHDEQGEGSAVDFEQELIVARPSKRKAYRQRLEIPMTPELYEHLMSLAEARSTMDPFFLEFYGAYVLPSLYLRYLGKRDFHAEFRRMCDTAGLKRHTFHGFRHAFVTRLVNAGVDAITVASMTGQTIQQVQEYSHVSTDAKKTAIESARSALHKTKVHEMGIGPRSIEI